MDEIEALTAIYPTKTIVVLNEDNPTHAVAALPREEDEYELFAIAGDADAKEYVLRVHVDLPMPTIALDVDRPSAPILTNSSSTSAPPRLSREISDRGRELFSRALGGGTEPDALYEKISALPPIYLHFALPHDYPLASPPHILALKCAWMTDEELEELSAELLASFEKGEPLLFKWRQQLQVVLTEGNYARYARETGRLRVASRTVADEIVQYTLRRFANEAHLCSICLEYGSGDRFLILQPCGHHFCKSCLRSWMEERLSRGVVQNLTCPIPKCDSPFTPDHAAAVLPRAAFERFEELLFARTLDASKDCAACPRCGTVNGSMDGVAMCSGCGFAYCTKCMDAYHSTSPCDADASMLAQEKRKYKNASREEIAERMREIRLSVIAIRSTTVPCPRCKYPISKTGGCNKVVCVSCSGVMCYLCGKDITKWGYAHFSGEGRAGGGCAGRLMDGINENLEREARVFGMDENALLEEEAGGEILENERWFLEFMCVVNRKTKGAAQCPRCKLWLLQEDPTSNVLRCGYCRKRYCIVCKTDITKRGATSEHFSARGPYGCHQHKPRGVEEEEQEEEGEEEERE